MSMVIPERTERKYEPYPEYKDSGVEWLGEIPDRWDVRKLKYAGQAILGLTYQPSDVVDEGQGTLVLRSSNIQNGRLSMQDNVYVKTLIPKKLITRIGDILICSRNGSRDLIGKNAKIMPSTVGETFGAFMTVFRSEICNYLYYVFNSQLFNYELGAFQTSTINQLTVNRLNSFQVPLPSVEEQNAITDFLDWETTRIDDLVAKKKKLIELLQEQRTALITHAVTKGLNPDVPMKDSEVEWLGEIPAHWEVKKLKYVAEIVTGNTPPKSDLENYDELEGLPWIKPDNLGTFLSVSESQEYLSAKGTALARVVPKEAVLTCCIGSIGSIGIAGRELATNQQINSVIFTGQRMHHKYGFYMVYASLPEYRKLANLNVVAIINSQTQKTIPIPLPPLPEQQTIADYLDRETARIDSLTERINQAIEKLQEYRSALITAAVTGKIDVRQHVS